MTWVCVQEAAESELQHLRAVVSAAAKRESDLVSRLRQEKELLQAEVATLRERCRLVESGDSSSAIAVNRCIQKMDHMFQEVVVVTW